MSNLLSGFKTERDSSGRLTVEFKSTNLILYLLVAVVAPLVFIGVNLQLFGGGSFGVPWWLVAGPVAIGALAAAIIVWAVSRSKVRVTIDHKKSQVVVDTTSGQSEILLANLVNAEFAASPSNDGNPAYRLQFVLQSGERIPATSLYIGGYGASDRENVVNAINSELKTRSGMVH